MRLRALDLFSGAGGISVGLARAGFDVTGVDLNPKVERYWRRGMEPYGGEFVCCDALEVLEQILRAQRGALAPLCDAYDCRFDLIHASPPCQAYTSLRHLCKGKVYPDLVDAVRERLAATGALWCIENVEGAPLAVPPGGSLVLLCGTMFGLQTPDGRAEIRRHRLFETSFPIVLRPACQHGHAPESLSVCGTGMGLGNAGKEAEVRAKRETLSVVGKKGLPGLSHERRARRAMSVTGHTAEIPAPGHHRRAMSITGNTPQTKTSQDYGRRVTRETFSIDDARAAMQIPWMPMKYLSQAIPPSYSEWIAKQALAALVEPAAGGRQDRLEERA